MPVVASFARSHRTKRHENGAPIVMLGDVKLDCSPLAMTYRAERTRTFTRMGRKVESRWPAHGAGTAAMVVLCAAAF